MSPRPNPGRDRKTERDLAEFIAGWREYLRWTRPDLAAEVALHGHTMSVNTIHAIETRGRAIYVDDLIALAAGFDMTILELLHRAGVTR